MKKDEVIYFDSFGVEYIPKEIMERIKNKNIKTIIFRIQDNNSVMCGYFCTLFVEYMLILLIYLVLGILKSISNELSWEIHCIQL